MSVAHDTPPTSRLTPGGQPLPYKQARAHSSFTRTLYNILLYNPF